MIGDIHRQPDATAADERAALDRKTYRFARRRAGAMMGFLIHLSVYLVVNASMIAIDLLSSPQVHWAHYPLLGWGLGVAIHGLVIQLLPRASALHGRLVERELRRLQS
jgi:hypothetical protein